MKNLLTLIFIMMIGLFRAYSQKTVTYPYDPGSVPANSLVDLIHLDADLSVDPYLELFSGKAAFRFRTIRFQTDSIVFYTPSMNFDNITLDGEKVNFSQEGSQVIIRPGELDWHTEHELVFFYRGNSGGGGYFSGWNDPSGRKRKQVWDHRPFGWLPYKDDRITMDLRITFDSAYQVFSNGMRKEVVPNPDGTKTWHYSMPREHPFFSTCLVIGDYRFKSLLTPGGTPLELLYYPGQEDHFEPTYRYTSEMFSFLEKELDFPYPYELYREEPVVDYPYAGMETTTATIFGDYLLIGPRAFWGRNYINVNVHELVHQWFGDCISHLRPADVWLTESFATYYAKLFEKHIFGDDQYQWIRKNEMDDVFDAAARNDFGVGHSHGGRERFYPKGSLVMDMMRDVLGDEQFRYAIHSYLDQYSFNTASTGEFLDVIRESSGIDLTWFFDQWILRGGEPHFKISWSELEKTDGNRFTFVRIKQIHQIGELIGYFKVPATVEVNYTDGSSDILTRWISAEYSEIQVPNPGKKPIAFVLFDPGRKLIKKVTFDRTFNELASQARLARNMIDRFDALTAMKSFPADKKREILNDIYGRETFHMIKSEVIRQLSRDSLSAALIRKAIHDPDAFVRRTVVEEVNPVTRDVQKDYEILLADSCYINAELALANLCSSFQEKTGQYLEMTKDETGWRGRNIRIRWLEIAIMNGEKEFLSELVDYSGISYEFETRKNALNTLQKLNYLDEIAVQNLLLACIHKNHRLSESAGENLRNFSKQNDYRNMIESGIRNGSWSERERQLIEKLKSVF